MLFWIFVILMIIGIALIAVDRYGVLEELGGVLVMLSALVCLVMLICIIIEHTGVDGYVAKMNAKREALVWQLENDIYENDNDLGKYELMSEIREWNEDLAHYQAVQDDFWVGIFHANIYDQFEPIPLE